mmetsp:Transcript_8801/g.15471  ORF Transcript_8801/g.15471 Transcript_8801/m.15471 type:complete len:234 (-) Transcript_8801:673-1374(-)
MTKVGRGDLVELGTNVAAPSTAVFEEGYKGVDVGSTPLTPDNPSRPRLHHLDLPLTISLPTRRQWPNHRPQRHLAPLPHTRRSRNILGSELEDALGHLDGVVDILLVDFGTRSGAPSSHSRSTHSRCAGGLLLYPSLLMLSPLLSVKRRTRLLLLWLLGSGRVESNLFGGGGRTGNVLGVGREHARLSRHWSGWTTRLLLLLLEGSSTELIWRPRRRRSIITPHGHISHGLIQ